MAQPRPTLCAADAYSPCASAKRQETTECAICGKVVRRGGLARHHLSYACRQAHAKRCCCGPASGKEADICAREVFGCNNGAVIIDGVDYAPKLSRAAHFNGYTPIPLPDRDHSGPAALLKFVPSSLQLRLLHGLPNTLCASTRHEDLRRRTRARKSDVPFCKSKFSILPQLACRSCISWRHPTIPGVRALVGFFSLSTTTTPPMSLWWHTQC